MSLNPCPHDSLSTAQSAKSLPSSTFINPNCSKISALAGMTQMGLFWCPKQVSSCSSSSGGRAAVAPATSRRHGDRSCGIGRLMRRLKKQSKMLCSVRRTATLPCQYDPLSYARNFDRTGFDDDSAQFSYTFSSRFVAPVTISDGRAPQLPAASL